METLKPGTQGRQAPDPSSRLLPIRRAAILALVFLVGLLSGAAFLLAFYPAFFHSDSAAHQVLAQAMIDQGSLVPTDFAYGNQIIIWRNNLFIAPVLALGFSGYTAYWLGSALHIALAFVAAFLCIELLVGDWRRALLATWLFFLPLGHTENDFVLGQQSHLALVVFSLIIVVLAFRATEGSRRAAILCAMAVFAVVLEAPARAVMIVVPLTITLGLTHRLRRARALGIAVVAALVLGLLGNRWLVSTHQVQGIGAMPLARYEQFVTRMNELLRHFVDHYIGFWQFAGQVSEPGYLLLYGIKTLALLAYGVAAMVLGTRALRRFRAGAGGGHVTAVEFVGIAGVASVLVGAFSVCAIEYWLYVRHILWALALLKLAIILAALEALGRHVRSPLKLTVLACVTAAVASTAVTRFLSPQSYARLKQEFIEHRDIPEFGRVQARMAEFGIRRIYGEHWEVLRTEVLIPGAQASVIAVQQGEVRFVNFLTRSSRRCGRDDVLYILDRGIAEQALIANELLANGGRLVENLVGNKGLYLGPPVWSQVGCS